MEISMADIDLNIYDDTINAISTGGLGGAKIVLSGETETNPEPQTENPLHGRNEAGRYPITIEKSKLQNPELLVAKLARELAYIKLLGEARIPEPHIFESLIF